MKVRELIKMLSENGWNEVRCRGSHRQFKHPDRQQLLTVAGNKNADIPIGTLNAILKQAGLAKREYR
jgi:predicted RNA binding protein YcfA (HicA-like mRNA interferase family)